MDMEQKLLLCILTLDAQAHPGLGIIQPVISSILNNRLKHQLNHGIAVKRLWNINRQAQICQDTGCPAGST